MTRIISIPVRKRTHFGCACLTLFSTVTEQRRARRDHDRSRRDHDRLQRIEEERLRRLVDVHARDHALALGRLARLRALNRQSRQQEAGHLGKSRSRQDHT